MSDFWWGFISAIVSIVVAAFVALIVATVWLFWGIAKAKEKYLRQTQSEVK